MKKSKVDVKIVKASLDDAKELTKISKLSFDDDSLQHGLGETGGPPGYDSIAAQRRWIKLTFYYKFIVNNEIVGGMFTESGKRFYQKSSKNHFYFIRIFIHPDYQNLGIGTKAMLFIENEFPYATKWTLDTPSWAERNHYFYEKLGYKKVGEKKEQENFILYFYEKDIV